MLDSTAGQVEKGRAPQWSRRQPKGAPRRRALDRHRRSRQRRDHDRPPLPENPARRFIRVPGVKDRDTKTGKILHVPRHDGEIGF